MKRKKTDGAMTLEEQLNGAIARNAATEIGRLLADEWVLFGADGACIERGRFLDVLASGELTHQAMTSDEWRVRTYDGCAVVSARTRSVGSWKGASF